MKKILPHLWYKPWSLDLLRSACCHVSFAFQRLQIQSDCYLEHVTPNWERKMWNRMVMVYRALWLPLSRERSAVEWYLCGCFRRLICCDACCFLFVSALCSRVGYIEQQGVLLRAARTKNPETEKTTQSSFTFYPSLISRQHFLCVDEMDPQDQDVRVVSTTS
jgi:hypothetical protein